MIYIIINLATNEEHTSTNRRLGAMALLGYDSEVHFHSLGPSDLVNPKDTFLLMIPTVYVTQKKNGSQHKIHNWNEENSRGA